MEKEQELIWALKKIIESQLLPETIKALVEAIELCKQSQLAEPIEGLETVLIAATIYYVQPTTEHQAKFYASLGKGVEAIQNTGLVYF